MENNPVTDIMEIAGKTASHRVTLVNLIEEHSEWYATSRSETETDFHDALQCILKLSDWIIHYVPGKEQLKIEVGVQQLTHELKNITKLCDILADQYITEKNRKHTIIISRFKDSAQQYFSTLQAVKSI